MPAPTEKVFTPFLHPCCEPGCKEEGIIGTGCFLLKGILGQWRCGPHERAFQARQAQQPAPTSSSVATTPQGRLL